MADTGTVLALVLAGHFIGDWVVQTDRQARHKVWPPVSAPAVIEHTQALTNEDVGRFKRRWDEMDRRPSGSARHHLWFRSWGANQRHMLGYHLTMAAFVLPAWHSWPVAGLLAVSWVTHSFIDRRWPVRWLMRHTGSGPFSETPWGVIAVDQALHLAILCVLVAALGS